ncbi:MULTISPECIES: ATP-dependent DNA ligase [unclassified Microcoleus]|uniref:ATP-dependent DNA ligase n=1 Tax=unclassified Microcoleus TaxID=2642155 RepID=UPI002FD00FFA
MLLQLANSYSPTKNYGVAEWLSSPKLDGVRCLYENPTNGLRSRSGLTRYLGLTEIEQICESIRLANNLSFLDGELYIPGEPFDRISGIARSTKTTATVVEAKQRMEFRIFAIGFTQYPNIVAADEYSQVQQIFPAMAKVSYVPQKLIENKPLVIQAEADSIKASGQSAEGIMLRNPNSVYFQGRSIALLKVKNFVKDHLPVTGFTKGSGKYSASLGNLLVGGTLNERIVKARVGTGFTDVERSTIWANQVNYMGRIVEVIHLGITATGALRHPVFSAFV